MRAHAAVQAYLADKNATWSDNLATWNEDGAERLLAHVDGPLTADAIIDAHVRALARHATLTIAHSGEATPVARRTAARFGVALLDATSLPPPAAAATSGEASPEVPVLLPAGGHPLLLPAHAPPAAPPFELGEAIASAWTDALAAIERRDARVAVAVESTGEAAPVPPVVAPVLAPTGVASPVGAEAAGVASPVEPALIEARSDPEPVVAHADPALPWDLSVSAPEPEPVHVEAMELAAMPWNLHSEQHELMPAGRAASFAPARPTQLAQDWGLPWPRPVVPTGGLAIADPKLWHNQERIESVREDLAKAGAPSFGAVKPEGSAWLKRITEFGAP